MSKLFLHENMTLTPISDLELHNLHRTCWQIGATKSPAFLVDLFIELQKLQNIGCALIRISQGDHNKQRTQKNNVYIRQTRELGNAELIFWDLIQLVHDFQILISHHGFSKAGRISCIPTNTFYIVHLLFELHIDTFI